MNIAVILTKDITEGGAFQYAVSVSLLLKKNASDKYNFIFFTTLKKNLSVLKKHNLSPIYLPWSNLDRFTALLTGSQLVSNIFTKAKIKLESKLDRIFKKYKVDLAYFLSPTDLTLALNYYNYIFTVWDLCFFDYPEFPEVYINREFERRETLYRLAITKAVAVVTDSEFTKSNIIKRYAIAENRVISLPFLPSNAAGISKKAYDSNFIDIKKKYNIDDKYIFYPAQFWPHKNHIYILDGLKLLKEKYNLKIHAVFSGSDKGNLSFILRKAKEFGIDNQIHYIGFIEDKELPYLYAQALALVMPTYFGPTNIPPLEAFSMGCPVLYSDLPGLKDQVKGAALLLGLNNPDTMCQGLLKILNNSPEINLFIENGRKKAESLMNDSGWEKLSNIFEDYILKLKTRG
ncbi:MAG: glycosyltransferase family 1 protein [Candidatus Omnitrophota bacterium]